MRVLEIRKGKGKSQPRAIKRTTRLDSPDLRRQVDGLLRGKLEVDSPFVDIIDNVAFPGVASSVAR